MALLSMVGGRGRRTTYAKGKYVAGYAGKSNLNQARPTAQANANPMVT